MTVYKFYREPGRYIKAQPERWRWEAYYTDGSSLKQFDDKELLYHQFREIDQSKLDRFVMRHEKSYLVPAITLKFKPWMKLIHYYENTVSMSMGRGPTRHEKVYCFGYEGSKGKTIIRILPDDSIEVTDGSNN